MIVTSGQYEEMGADLADKLFTDARGYEYDVPLYIKLTEVEQADMDFWDECIGQAEEYLEIIGIQDEED